MKKLPTTKLFNFSRSTTFIFVVFPSEVVYKIWIQTQFCMTRWFQIKKLPATIFHNFSRSTEFILVVFPSEVVWKVWILKFWNSNTVLHDKDDFKSKSCQLQSFITFRDLQSLFWLFGHLFIRHGRSNIVHKSYISLL